MKFEKGDVLHSVDYVNPIGWIIIFDGYCPEFKYSVMLNRNQELVYNDTCVGSGFKLANSEQKKILFDALAKENKYYCEKTKTIKEMKKEFTKKDLKSGMWVESREGNIYLVLFNCDTKLYGSQKLCFVRYGTFITSDEYDEELLANEYSSFDIVRVYYHGSVGGKTLKFEGTPLIWERETQEDKQMKEMQFKLEEMKKAYNELEISISETIDKINGLKK